MRCDDFSVKLRKVRGEGQQQMTVVRDSSAARNHSRKSSVKASSRICDFFWCTSPSVYPHKQPSRNLTHRRADIHHESTDCHRADCSIPCLVGRTETGRCFVTEEVHVPVCCTTGAVSQSVVGNTARHFPRKAMLENC